MKRFTMLGALVAIAVSGTAAHGQVAKPAYKRDVPDSLAKKAKITEADAVATAQKRVPKGTIDALEMERENGKLLYSFDFKVPGKTGIDEVNVDAMTGKVVGGVTHESPATEKKEAAAEAKAATKKKP